MAGNGNQKILYEEGELGPLDPADAFDARYESTFSDHALVIPHVGRAYDAYGDGYGDSPRSVAPRVSRLLATATWDGGTRSFDELLEHQRAVSGGLPGVDMADQAGESRNLIEKIMQQRAAHVIDWLHSLRCAMNDGLLVLLEYRTADRDPDPDPDKPRDTPRAQLRAVWLDGFALRAREHTGDRPDIRIVPGYDILAVGRGRNGALGVLGSVAMHDPDVARVFELTAGYRPTVRGARRRAQPAISVT